MPTLLGIYYVGTLARAELAIRPFVECAYALYWQMTDQLGRARARSGEAPGSVTCVLSVARLNRGGKQPLPAGPPHLFGDRWQDEDEVL